MKSALKQKALDLRRQGYSFREISLSLGLSKSTVGLWTRLEPLSDEAKLRLKELGDKGRVKAKETTRLKQALILKEIENNCGALVNKAYGCDEYKLLLAALYWGEGSKTGRRLNFMNSDPDMIRTYLFLFRKSFTIMENKFRARVHLHEYHNREEMIDFWSNITGIHKNLFSVYNKPHTGINKKVGYKGCLSIYYGDSRILKEIFIIIDRLKNLANIAGLV